MTLPSSATVAASSAGASLTGGTVTIRLASVRAWAPLACSVAVAATLSAKLPLKFKGGVRLNWLGPARQIGCGVAGGGGEAPRAVSEHAPHRNILQREGEAFRTVGILQGGADGAELDRRVFQAGVGRQRLR